MSGNSDRAAWRVTTDREQILEWAEAHETVPVRAEGADGSGLRLLANPDDERGEQLSWDQFFERFEAESLALRYRETATTTESQPAYEFVDRNESTTAETDEQEAPGSVGVYTREDDRSDVGESQPTPPGTEGSGVTQVDSETVRRGDEETSSREATTTGTSQDDAADRDAETAVLESSQGAEAGAFVLDEIHEEHGFTDGVDEEYVTFRNTADESLDLSGWVVENDDGRTFVFPEGFVLDPGGNVTLHSGRGSDTETDVYWGATDAVWDDDGDTVTVMTADGREVLREPYGK